jgi:hypothetical protein
MLNTSFSGAAIEEGGEGKGANIMSTQWPDVDNTRKIFVFILHDMLLLLKLLHLSPDCVFAGNMV